LISWRKVELRVSDLAILLVVLVVARTRRAFESRDVVYRWVWFTPFLALLLVSGVNAQDRADVTVGVLKLVEYFILGLGASLVLWNRRAIQIVVGAFVASAAVLGFIGAVEILRSHRLGARAESLTGTDPLGLIGAAIIAVVWSAPSLLGTRRFRRAAAATGVLCFVVAGSMSAALGLLLAGTFAAARRLGGFAEFRRRSILVGAVSVLGAVVLLLATRWNDVSAAARHFGPNSSTQTQHSGSFIQRLMFADFGFRIWLDHPVLGVGFQQTPKLSEWGPYFASVRADFPTLPITYFPEISGMSFGQPVSTTKFSLHTVYSQLLAETGVVGFVLFSLGFVGAAGPAFRHARKSEVACIGALVVLVVLGALTRNELYGGLPETTVMVLGLAFAVRGSEWSSAQSSSGPMAGTALM
jgi:hypothetical protein